MSLHNPYFIAIRRANPAKFDKMINKISDSASKTTDYSDIKSKYELQFEQLRASLHQTGSADQSTKPRGSKQVLLEY